MRQSLVLQAKLEVKKRFQIKALIQFGCMKLIHLNNLQQFKNSRSQNKSSPQQIIVTCSNGLQKAGILSKLDVVVHSHDHASSLYYSAKHNDNGEIISDGYCQLTPSVGAVANFRKWKTLN